VALQVGDGWLRLLDDYVLKAMLEQLGAKAENIEAPFQPEHGAYGGGHHHSRHGDEDFNYPPKLHQFGVRL
jgi:urease accessory protein